MRGHGQDDAVCIQPFSANLDLIAVLASPHGERGVRDELRLLEALEQTCNKGLHPRPRATKDGYRLALPADCASRPRITLPCSSSSARRLGNVARNDSCSPSPP